MQRLVRIGRGSRRQPEPPLHVITRSHPEFKWMILKFGRLEVANTVSTGVKPSATNDAKAPAVY